MSWASASAASNIAGRSRPVLLDNPEWATGGVGGQQASPIFVGDCHFRKWSGVLAGRHGEELRAPRLRPPAWCARYFIRPQQAGQSLGSRIETPLRGGSCGIAGAAWISSPSPSSCVLEHALSPGVLGAAADEAARGMVPAISPPSPRRPLARADADRNGFSADGARPGLPRSARSAPRMDDQSCARHTVHAIWQRARTPTIHQQARTPIIWPSIDQACRNGQPPFATGTPGERREPEERRTRTPASLDNAGSALGLLRMNGAARARERSPRPTQRWFQSDEQARRTPRGTQHYRA